MSDRSIQIVAFNNPYPANFGGAIDMFYKIKALYSCRLKIYLHIFYDDREDVFGLQEYCENIYLYKREKSIKKQFSLLPFTINSRQNDKLIDRLKESSAPILFESLRSCEVIIGNEFSQNIAIRNHNIEHKYSWGLAKSETNWIKKWAHYFEGFKQKRFEKILSKADVLFNISREEQHYFSKKYSSKSIYLPVFHAFTEIKSKEGFGAYALYHGDLSISDNLKSAIFLINVFKSIKVNFIIASSIKPKVIIDLVNAYDTISFEKIKDNEQLQYLIENAHINALYSFQRSGTKLKVFNALFNGRHCILNDKMVDDLDILSACEVAENSDDYRKKILLLFKQEFKQTDKREKALTNYNNLDNANVIIKNLF